MKSEGVHVKRTDSTIERVVGKFIPVWFPCDDPVTMLANRRLANDYKEWAQTLTQNKRIWILAQPLIQSVPPFERTLASLSLHLHLWKWTIVIFLTKVLQGLNKWSNICRKLFEQTVEQSTQVITILLFMMCYTYAYAYICIHIYSIIVIEYMCICITCFIPHYKTYKSNSNPLAQNKLQPGVDCPNNGLSIIY